MPFAHPQASAVANTNGSSTSTSAVLTNNPANGDLVCVGLFWSNGTGTPPASLTVADSNGNNYTKSTNSPSSVKAATAGHAYCFYLLKASNASKTVTVSYSNPGAGGAVEIIVDDFTVTGGNATFDQDAISSGTGNITSPTVPVSGANELAYGYASPSGDITAQNAPWTAGGHGADGSASEFILSRSSSVALDMTTAGDFDSVGMSFLIANATTPPVGRFIAPVLLW